MTAALQARIDPIAVVDWWPLIAQAGEPGARGLALGQDSIGDHVEKAISAWRERRLIPEPCECSQQPEQVGAVYIGSCHALSLRSDKEVGARRAHRLA